jgi:hypothetical protein
MAITRSPAAREGRDPERTSAKRQKVDSAQMILDAGQWAAARASLVAIDDVMRIQMVFAALKLGKSTTAFEATPGVWRTPARSALP